MINHISVAGLHTAVIIHRGKDDGFIRAIPDGPIDRTVFFRPARRLIFAGKDQNQPGIRVRNAKLQHLKGGERIKPQGAAAHEPSVTLIIGAGNRTGKGSRNGRQLFGQKTAMTGKTSGFGDHESIFSTARNASLGT